MTGRMSQSAASPSARQGAEAYDQARQNLLSGQLAGTIEAVRLADWASNAGHAEADVLLALLAGAGVGMPQSWERALDHLLAGAERGSVAARGQLAALAGEAVAGGGDWPSLRRAIRPADWLAPPAKTVISQAPRVVAIRSFLAAPVCDWIIGRAKGRTGPALVYDPATGAAQPGDGRNNSSFEFAFLDLDLVVLMVRARMAATIGVPAQLFESPQVLHYDVGQAFAPHHDYLDPHRPWTAGQIAAAGQRIVTFLVYLNDGYDGGETDFPRLGLRHPGRRGSALYFGNVDTSGTPDPGTLHAGLAPTRGEKWLFSQWIRDRPRT